MQDTQSEVDKCHRNRYCTLKLVMISILKTCSLGHEIIY